MKKCKKLLAFTLSVLLAFACYVVPAFASSSASQYGLEATLVTDKESYKANEEIYVTVTVKNTNDFKVEAVSIESLLPETLTLKDGSNSTKTVDLEPGETLTLSFTAVKEKKETSATEPTETEPVLPSESETVKPSESESVKSTIGTIDTAIDDSTTVFPKEVTEMNSATIIHSNNPNTGDITSIKTVVIAIIAVLALIAIILILLHKHQKQTTKIISLVMCVAVATTAITGVSFFTAKGTDDGLKSFTVEKVITVDGEETNVSADVKYQEPKQTEAELGLVIDQKDFTTIHIKENLTGSFGESHDIAKIEYSLSQGDECFDTGEAIIENRNWKLSQITLRPEENLLTITAVTTTGTTQSKSIRIYYDRGKAYTPNESNIVPVPNDMDRSYVNNIVVIRFITKDQSKQEDIIKSIGGKIVGRIGDSEYHVQISSRSLDELKKLCEDLRKKPQVFDAFYDSVEQTNISEIPNDSWKDNIQGSTGVDWNEEKPSGYNWWLETIQAPSAWDYKDRFKKISIAVVDNGFDTNHEDLSIRVLNKQESNAEDHGTHVAGIIGATANNNKGITGIVWNCDLLGIDVYHNKQQDKNQVTITTVGANDGIQMAIEQGAKVINYSSGLEHPIKKEDTTMINQHGEAYARSIAWWQTEISKDFLIVQSAGNDNCDAIRNGYFCSMTQDNVNTVLTSFRNDFPEGEEYKPYKQLSVSDILDRVLIVGAVQQKNSGYELVNFLDIGAQMKYTCYGSQISVVAPGRDIFSTVVTGGIDGSYANMSGTSMAAPIVSGVAGLVWSVNENFTPSEVNHIVCTATKDTARNYSKEDARSIYPVVNAKLAVEEAIRKTDSDAKFVGGDGSVNNPYQIANDAQLNAVRNYPESNFILLNDIDLSRYNWVPIPKFSGSLDGKGHAIKNLKMDYEIANNSIDKYFPETNGFSQRIASFGLFSEITNSSEVKNIDLEAMNIHIVNAIEKDSLPIDTELYIQVAGIAGASENSLINNCTTSGKIKLDDSSMKGIGYSIAGICALANSSQIINCTNIANVHVGVAAPHSIFDDVAIGGIISVSWGGDISRCINKGNINAIVLNKTTLHCGGILGYSNGKNKDDKMLPIQLCQNYGNIKVMGSDFIYAGGILGWSMARQLESNINYGDITSCANVYASSGGIVGQMGPSLDGWLWYEINKCVNYGDVSTEAIINPESAFTGTPNSHAGGISGKLADTGMSIENCYNLCSKIVSDTHDAAGNKFLFSLSRICSDCFEASRGYPILECYSLITTTLNGTIPTEDIGPDKKNGGSMTKAEIEKAIQDLGFELPGELPNAS